MTRQLYTVFFLCLFLFTSKPEQRSFARPDCFASAMKPKSEKHISTSFNSLEGVIKLQRLVDLDSNRISHYQTALRKRGSSPATIASYLRTLHAALNWAVTMKLIPEGPR